MIGTDAIYELLPAVYRLRDADQAKALEALVSILSDQADVIDRDIERLYDNWFIETCDPWLIPYIGDLLAVRPLYQIPGAVSQRSYVANTIRYRRRKGTVSVLEQLAYDVTGWRGRAVEFFQLLETTQYLNHLRPANLRTPDLRDGEGLELLGGPFARAARTAEVRRIAPRRGRYNLPNVGLYLWRLASYPIGLDDLDAGPNPTTRGTAHKIADGRYTVNPLGLDASLFNDPSHSRQTTDRIEEVDVPGVLRRRALFDELEARRRASLGWAASPSRFFNDRRHPVRIWTQLAAGGTFTEIPAAALLVADLQLWQRPPPKKDYPTPSGGTAAVSIEVALDPVLGRLTFPPGTSPNAVEVGYAYGFAADVGGGPYDRRDAVDPQFLGELQFLVGVGRDLASAPGKNFPTLTQAIQAWNAEPAGRTGVIAVLDSRTYEESLTGSARIELKEGSNLLLVAAERPKELPDVFAPSLVRPHLKGSIEVIGKALPNTTPGRLQLDGILIEGSVTLQSGNLGRLTLTNCTVAGGKLAVEASSAGAGVVERRVIELKRTISGPVAMADGFFSLVASESVIRAQSTGAAIDAPLAAVEIQASTVLGNLAAKTLTAENSILDGVVAVARAQTGCVRFSFVRADPGCRTPRRYRCQPDLALSGVTDPAEQARVISRVRPTFASLRYGDPAYAQLALRSAPEIRTGAGDGAEMGVFYLVKQPQREANLEVALAEYLPFGLEAGAFYVT